MRLITALLFAAPAFAQVQLWGQCGGINYSGQTTCVSGAVCTKSNDWYSQCIPGTAPPVATTPPVVIPPTTVVTPPTTIITSVVVPPTGDPVTTAPPTGETTCAAVPSNPTLSTVSKLNDPFLSITGSRVTTKAQWTCRANELKELFYKYELGTLPPKPSSVTASFSGSSLSISVSEGGKSISFSVSITYPSSGTAPYPAIIAYGGGSIPAPAGVAMINFNNDDIAAQASTGSRGQGKFYTIYGSGHSAGALTAWAWGVDRIIDGLELASAARINPKKVGVTGCSRNGKGAMVAGALVPRIALTLPQESGAGGAACWRVSDSIKAGGTNIQTASQIITENVWFSKNFESYVNKVTTLPFDHHLLAGLVAPRALYVMENNIDWLGPASTYACMKTGQMIYKALGVPDNMGFSGTTGHNHCAFPSSQQSELTAFVQKFLFDQNTNTAISKSDQSFDQAKWVDWTTPTLS